MTPQVSVGIVGAGVIVQTIHLPVLLATPNVRVAWIVDASEALAGNVAKAFGIPFAPMATIASCLERCDVALIGIPNAPRGPYFEMAAEKGVAIVAEKPFAINLRDHQKFQRLFSPNRIACGYQRRMFSTSRFLRDAVSSGCFGPLRRIVTSDGGRTTRTGNSSKYHDLPPNRGGGILLNLGCHALDLAVFVTQTNAHSVDHKRVEFDDGVDREVSARISLSALSAQLQGLYELDLTISWLTEQRNTIELHFDKTILKASTAPSAMVSVHCAQTSRLLGMLDTSANGGAVTVNQAVFQVWSEFLAGLESGAPSPLAASNSETTAAIMDDVLGFAT
ncbi:Oxidoreductase family, NAD-binding Rossmann fold [Rhizobiales bacterium GAS191]|nr:Oxidoreductase family, NAD-binding Rossmann fold [Rhizobiales bacterium GAS191]